MGKATIKPAIARAIVRSRPDIRDIPSIAANTATTNPETIPCSQTTERTYSSRRSGKRSASSTLIGSSRMLW